MRYTFMFAVWSSLIGLVIYNDKYKAALYLVIVAFLHVLWVIAEHTEPKKPE